MPLPAPSVQIVVARWREENEARQKQLSERLEQTIGKNSIPRTGLTKQVYYSLGPQYRRIEVFISRPAKVSRLGQSLSPRTVFPKGFSGGLWELGGLEQREKALGTTYPLKKITTGSNRKWGLTAVSQLILFFTISHSLRLSYF